MPTIVDINAIADIFGFSAHTLKTEWRDYPHFFPGRGRGKNSRSARFVLEDVIAYLTYRDYTESQKNAIQKQKVKTMGGASKNNGGRGTISIPRNTAALEKEKLRRKHIHLQKGQIPKGQNQIHNQENGQNLGNRPRTRSQRFPDRSDRHNILSVLKSVS